MTIGGTTEFYYQRSAATHAVQHLHGVRQVHNNLTIKPMETAHEIHEHIAAALRRRADIDAGNVKVTASGGEVRLSGTVSSWAERQRVAETAWAGRGVTNVVDDVHIR